MTITSTSKRVLLAGGAALILGGSALGVAAAQSTPAPLPTAQASHPARQQFVETLAAKLGVTTDALRQAIEETRKEIGPSRRPGPGPRMREHGRAMVGAARMELDAAASYLGIAKDELRDTLREGTSLAQIATEKGKSVEGLVDAMVSQASERIDAAVAAGKLPAERAAQMKERLTEMVTNLVNRTPPQRPERPAAFSRGSF